jgi:GNAT superfamily N-acetyltransferase
MEIRNLDLQDFRSLFALVLEVYSDTPSAMWFIRRPDEQGFRLIFKGKMEGMMAKDVVDLVAVEDGAIVGECEIVRRKNEVGILGLIVLKSSRKKGIGSALFSKAVEMAEAIGITRLRAEVAEENASAAIFLAKNGFSMNGTMPRETETGIRNITLMLKSLA